MVLEERSKFNGSYEEIYYDLKPLMCTRSLNSNGPVVEYVLQSIPCFAFILVAFSLIPYSSQLRLS